MTHVLDCKTVEKYIRKEKSNKTDMILLNAWYWQTDYEESAYIQELRYHVFRYLDKHRLDFD